MVHSSFEGGNLEGLAGEGETGRDQVQERGGSWQLAGSSPRPYIGWGSGTLSSLGNQRYCSGHRRSRTTNKMNLKNSIYFLNAPKCYCRHGTPYSYFEVKCLSYLELPRGSGETPLSFQDWGPLSGVTGRSWRRGRDDLRVIPVLPWGDGRGLSSGSPQLSQRSSGLCWAPCETARLWGLSVFIRGMGTITPVLPASQTLNCHSGLKHRGQIGRACETWEFSGKLIRNADS